MIRRLLRGVLPNHGEGGALPALAPRPGGRWVQLSPGRRIDDPDEAEALGLTATVRRLRNSLPG
ncbi:hypothetical protein QFZ63_001492 [Streptomyces sp. B3I7]|nr:hypothetical protein [Streptomyces sp. B3I7]